MDCPIGVTGVSRISTAGLSLPIFISERIPYVHLYRAAGACVTLQFRDYLPLRTGPNAGGEMRRFEAASYADATRRIRSSAPGSARNTRENGRPGAGSAVGVLLLAGMYRFRSGLSVKFAS